MVFVYRWWLLIQWLVECLRRCLINLMWMHAVLSCAAYDCDRPCQVAGYKSQQLSLSVLLQPYFSDAVQLTWLRPLTKLRHNGRFEVRPSQASRGIRHVRYKQAYLSLNVSFQKRISHRIHCRVQNQEGSHDMANFFFGHWARKSHA